MYQAEEPGSQVLPQQQERLESKSRALSAPTAPVMGVHHVHSWERTFQAEARPAQRSGGRARLRVCDRASCRGQGQRNGGESGQTGLHRFRQVLWMSKARVSAHVILKRALSIQVGMQIGIGGSGLRKR